MYSSLKNYINQIIFVHEFIKHNTYILQWHIISVKQKMKLKVENNYLTIKILIFLTSVTFCKIVFKHDDLQLFI